MIRRPPRSTRTDTLFPYTTLFRSSGTGTALIKAIDVIRDANTRKSRDLPDGVPLPFPNRQWKRLLTESGRIDRRRYEIAIMATFSDRLRAGDVWIEGTRNYQRFDAYLLSRRDASKVAVEIGRAACWKR